MRVYRHPGNLRRMLRARLKQLTTTTPVLAASLMAVRRVCGQPSCHCHHGEKHLAHQLTYKVRGKTHTVYVPVDFLEEVRSWIDEHRRVKRLLGEISQLSLALVRSHAQERQRRRGRS